MPSISATIIPWVLRTTGVYRRMFGGGPTAERHWKKAQSSPSRPPAKLHKSCAISSREFQGRPVWEIAPKDRAPTSTILFWHGGGYIYPPTPGHWDYCAHMAKVHGWRIIMPLYPLSPAHNVESITSFALAFYRDFTASVDPAQFVMAGDSAGGGLTAATAMLARDAGLPLPKGLILICPWLNVAPNHPDQTAIAPRDAILTLQGIREAGAHYAADRAIDDPLVSPIHGSWDRLPPMLCFGGGDDILVTDARALKAKHPAVDYHELAKMIHDWPLFLFPESRAAQQSMAEFARSAKIHPSAA